MFIHSLACRIDATAVRSCLLTLQQRLDHLGILLAFASVDPSTEILLRAQQILGEKRNASLMGDVEAALEWCEDRIIERELGPIPGQPFYPEAIQQQALFPDRMDLEEIFSTLIDIPKHFGPMLAAYFERREYEPGETIFVAGDPSDELYFVEQGEVSLFKPVQTISSSSGPLPATESRRRKDEILTLGAGGRKRFRGSA